MLCKMYSVYLQLHLGLHSISAQAVQIKSHIQVALMLQYLPHPHAQILRRWTNACGQFMYMPHYLPSQLVSRLLRVGFRIHPDHILCAAGSHKRSPCTPETFFKPRRGL